MPNGHSSDTIYELNLEIQQLKQDQKDNHKEKT